MYIVRLLSFEIVIFLVVWNFGIQFSLFHVKIWGLIFFTKLRNWELKAVIGSFILHCSIIWKNIKTRTLKNGIHIIYCYLSFALSIFFTSLIILILQNLLTYKFMDDICAHNLCFTQVLHISHQYSTVMIILSFEIFFYQILCSIYI